MGLKENDGGAVQQSRYEVLQQVSSIIASQADLNGVLEDLARFLPSVVSCEFLGVALHDPERRVFRLYAFGGTLARTPEIEMEIPSTDQATATLLMEEQKPIILNDIEKETRFADVVEGARQHGVRSLCLLPLTSPRRRLGLLIFGTTRQNDYDQEDLKLMATVTAHVAVAVENALNFEQARSYHQLLAHERDRLRLLLEVNNNVISHLELGDLFQAVSSALRDCFHHEYTGLWLFEEGSPRLRCVGMDFPSTRGFLEKIQFTELTPEEVAEVRARLPRLIKQRDIAQLPAQFASPALAENFQSGVTIPLVSGSKPLGILSLASTDESTFQQEELGFLLQVGNQVALAIENALAYEKVAEARNQLNTEKTYLEDEIRYDHNVEDIVGKSRALRETLSKAEVVAGTDATVLLMGETGTGKELVARLIHKSSSRRDHTFVKVNCAAVPSGLIESELFGHERGAFTGAVATKAGRFELAHRGSLFLDEVGDIALDLQPKLLRVLQEKEFERLGSTRTQKVDARLIAATNRDLAQMAASGEFREDLYYRLAVFPIQLPPLRERREDIPQLVEYFVARFARRMKKRIREIPTPALQAMTEWTWPGNIRELQNFIERAVILSTGDCLNVPLEELELPRAERASKETARSLNLREVEREAILEALRKTKGRIGGPQGAAALLGLKRTTLQSRMRLLNIKLSLHPSESP
ncbi:MAG: sigma 54-interacting transcriptional regulator [Terriglobia bacterium]